MPEPDGLTNGLAPRTTCGKNSYLNSAEQFTGGEARKAAAAVAGEGGGCSDDYEGWRRRWCGDMGQGSARLPSTATQSCLRYGDEARGGHGGGGGGGGAAPLLARTRGAANAPRRRRRGRRPRPPASPPEVQLRRVGIAPGVRGTTRAQECERRAYPGCQRGRGTDTACTTRGR